jgi:hypothetical protein
MAMISLLAQEFDIKWGVVTDFAISQRKDSPVSLFQAAR